MLQASGSSLGTSLLQVLILVFAGFGTLLLRIYDTDPENMDSDDPEVLGWVFMSYSITFLYPTFIFTLSLISSSGGRLVTYIIYFLGVFISGPVLVLSLLNIRKAVQNDDGINWKSYQRVLNFASGIIIWLTFFGCIYYFFLEPLL